MPINNISRVEIQEAPVITPTRSAEGHVRFAVIVHLVAIEDYTMFVNGAAQSYLFLRLAFDDRNVANTLRHLILGLQDRAKPDIDTLSGSEKPSDGSEAIDSDDQHDVSPSPAQRHIPRRIIRSDWSLTDLAVGFEPNDEKIPMVGDGTELGLVATAISPHRMVDKDTILHGAVPPGEGRLRNTNHLPKHEIRIPGRVSQNGPENPREENLLRSLEVEPRGILATQGTRSPLDTIATSSAQWRDGVNAIDNAPELASQIYTIEPTANSMSQPGGKGTRPLAETETILPTVTKSLQLGDGISKKPSNTTAVEEINVLQSAAQVTGPTAGHKRKVSKASQCLPTRDGEQIESVGTGEEATRPKKYSKSTKGASIHDNDMHTKKRFSRKTITYAAASKPAIDVNQVSPDAEPSDLAGEDDVFAIPNSPARPSKPSAKIELKKTVKKAKSTKSKGVSKSAKAKPVLGVAMLPVPKRASASKRARAPPKAAVVQENIQDSESFIVGDDRDMHQGEEFDDVVAENLLMTINEENYSAQLRKNLSTQVAEGISKDLTSDTKTVKSSITGISGRNTAITSSKSKHHDLAVPRRQLPRRMAAVHANQKLQGLKTEDASLDTNEKLNHDRITPENREHVRRTDKAGLVRERSALEAGPSLLAKSQLSTVQNKNKNRWKQPSATQNMAQSKGIRHEEANVDIHSPTISSSPDPLLTKSSHLLRHPFERDVDDFQDPRQAQETDISKPLVSSVDPRSPEESVDLITACKMPHTSDELVEKHFEQALAFTGDDDEISFADTFLEHEPEAPMAGQSPQLQYLKTPSNLEPGRLSVVDQRSHPTSVSRVCPIPMTTPTVIPPLITTTSSIIRTVQSSSTKIASNGKTSKTALPVHDNPVALTELQHVGVWTSAYSPSHTRPVQDHPTINKPADTVQDAFLDTKLISHKVAEQQENETDTAVKLKLVKQSSKAYTGGPICECPPAATNDNIRETASIQGLGGAAVSQPASELIEISSSVEASSGEDTGISQKWSETEHRKEQVSRKRKSNGQAGSTSKQIKTDRIPELLKGHGTPGNPAEQPISLDDVSVEATDDRVQRKTIIIGFNSNGPRNQGIPSSHKPHAEQQLPSLKAPVLTKDQPSSRKRKHMEEQQTVDNSFSPQRAKDVPIKKPRSTITTVPPTPQANEKLNVQISTSFQNPTVRQSSSQRSRVQENGSPAPTKSQIPRVNSIDISHLTDKMVDNLSNNFSADLDFEKGVFKQKDREYHFAHEVDLLHKKPLSLQKRLPSIMEEDIDEPLSKVEKLLPNSPNAIPWISADMAHYYEQTDGSLVNFQMEDVVHVAKISDPFSDMNQNQTNSFIETLRATGGAGKGDKKPNPEDIDFTLHKEGVKYIGLVDPDKTLVEPRRRRRPRNAPSSGRHSSSSHSSGSNGRKDHSGTSDSEAGEQRTKYAREWQEALQQHQKRPLNSLSEMSNVSSDRSTFWAQLTMYDSVS